MLTHGHLDHEIVDNMATWQHSGFHVFASEHILPKNKDHLLFLGRYLAKAPLALNRIELHDDALIPTVRYHKQNDDCLEFRDFSPLEFLAELSCQIPVSIQNFPHSSLLNFAKMLMYFYIHSAFRKAQRLDYGIILNAYKAPERLPVINKSSELFLLRYPVLYLNTITKDPGFKL